ncbi:OmpA family protein [Flagellimonas sediminis]|uniref:OmpA family protein n=1 Tax=Flagellimonas sediminis TaxID=2696468 RepID=A0A6I5KNW1_9FLAO|nr:OmpA family protein [Allomuricauda sediminis]NDV42133.1 OmpA family protein [Allomuricauda sediminis]
MKKLIFPFILLLSFGMQSQDVSLLEFNGDIASNSKQGPAEPFYPDESLKHLDGLSDKKLTRYVRKEGIAEKLIEKGNDYFNKMWYAEAARIYDIVLEKSEAKHTMSLLSNAGDSHYYSGNMEKSFKWYNELYELYTDEIPEDTFFKYTQTLKGTGKYRRASALTKLYYNKDQNDLREAAMAKPLTWKGATSVKVKNLAINSPYSDFSPMYHNGTEIVYASAKDSSFLTTRRYRWTNQPFLDLYVAKTKNDEGDLTGSRKFSKKINTKYHEASMAFSPDQKTIYFTRNNYGKKLKRGENGINHLKIYRSQLVGGEWTEAEELPFNSDDYSTGHPSISPDGHKMYFVSDRPGGFGQTDIYVVDILENGGFSEPQNLGRSVNTSAKEMFPYITDNALYFSSNRAMGFGGLDVYKSDSKDNMFSVGINLGEPINSNRDDFSYIIDTTGEKGYFASNRKGGKGDDDIYSFQYTLNLNAVTGSIQDAETGEVMEGAKVSLLDKDGNLLAETTTDAFGAYTFKNLDPLAEYGIKSQSEDYYEDRISFKTKENENIEVSQHLKKLNKILDEEKVKKPFEPNAVHFAFDSYKISPEAAVELDKLIAVLKEDQNLTLKIESHTDAVGSNAYNKYLSDRRAKATRDYIISEGIDPTRILSAIGYGEERLLNDCSDGKPCPPDKQLLNRRSEFILVSR